MLGPVPRALRKTDQLAKICRALGVAFNTKKPQKLVLQTKKSVQSLSDLSKITKKMKNTPREFKSFWQHLRNTVTLPITCYQ